MTNTVRQRKIKSLKELAKEHDLGFEQLHVEDLSFIEAEDTAAYIWKKPSSINTLIVSRKSSNYWNNLRTW